MMSKEAGTSIPSSPAALWRPDRCAAHLLLQSTCWALTYRLDTLVDTPCCIIPSLEGEDPMFSSLESSFLSITPNAAFWPMPPPRRSARL